MPLRAIERPRVILDCDPGHDDAVALAVASATCDIAAITTVTGNAPLRHCTQNALAIVELLGLDVPVFSGAARPLLRENRHAVAIHGEDGLGGVQVPGTTRTVEATSAVEAIIELTRATEGMWLVPTGPLTNIALALRADPRLADRVAGISLMGGGIARGNATPAAEFNFWFDPEAAAIVLAGGTEIRMCGLDVTQQVLVDRAFGQRVAATGGPVAEFYGQVFEAYARSCEAATGHPVGAMHDPCAVVALVRPGAFDFEHLPVAVEHRGGATAGMSVADRRITERGPTAPPNTHVALGVRAAEVLEVVFDAVAGRPPAPMSGA